MLKKLERTTIGSTIALSCLAYVSLALPFGAYAKTYYVSKSAKGPVHNGANWNTAFATPGDISEKVQLNPGDVIEIDGGPAGMVYAGGLQITGNGLPGQPITVKTSSQSGRNGRVVLVGKKDGDTGVSLAGDYIQVIGRSWRSLRIMNFSYGIVAYAPHSKLTNIGIDRNGVGLYVLGGGTDGIFRQLIVNDNARNALIEPNANGVPRFSKCWIYNSDQNAFKCNGIDVANAFNGGSMSFHGCIVGPGLADSFGFWPSWEKFSSWHPLLLKPKPCVLTVTHTLLLNAGQTNFAIPKTKLNLTNVTSFMTPLNSKGQSHCSFSTGEEGTTVNESVFYGGVIGGAPYIGTEPLGKLNLQFRTSGDTMLLSPRQTNPLFLSNVDQIRSNSLPSQLYNINLAHRVLPSSGSQLTSINQLLSTNQP